MKKLFFLLTLLLSISLSSLYAQAPKITNVFPVNLSVVSSENLEIVIDFDEALDLSTVDFSSFKVFGRWTGPRTNLAFSTINGDKTVKLLLDTSDDPFNAGEWVTVSVNTLLKAANGESLANGYTWNFWIATQPGSLKQEKTKTIALRQTGEDWLQTYGAYAGDLDNDGYSDLTVINENSDDLRILLNDKAGNFFASQMEVYPMGQATPSPNEGADFNFDGDIDLAVCTAHDNELRVLFGDGEGSFYAQDDYTTGTNARGLVVTDYNGDGVEDIIIANRGSSDLSFFENDGTGSFEETRVDLDPQGEGESGLVCVDANNDGIPALFVGNYTSQEVALFIGDGEGGFTIADKAPLSGQDRPWMMTTGDFNKDGFADLASANSNGNSVTIHLNDGNEGFLPNAERLVHPSGVFPLAIDAGDIDGDGDIDLVSSNYTSISYVVYENIGLGVFAPADVLTASKNASCAILHDRDNDGDLDITATDEGDDVVFIFENELIDNSTEEAVLALNSIQVSPNPFVELVTIDFDLQDQEEVVAMVVNEEGKIITKLFDGKLASGKHQLVWEGKNNKGSKVANGIYFLQMTIGERMLTKEILKK